jgi:Leucine-rich repeat (LRR) protein
MTNDTIRFEGHDLRRDAAKVELVNVEWPDFGPLTQLDHLRELRLTHTNPHRSPGGLSVELDPLASIENLEVLVLPHYPIRDLAPLHGLSRLRVVDLSFTPIDSVESLRELHALRELRLRATQVGNLEPLRGLARLASLDVAHTAVSDIAPLESLPELRQLYLVGTSVSDEQVAALQNARPAVVVVKDPFDEI